MIAAAWEASKPPRKPGDTSPSLDPHQFMADLKTQKLELGPLVGEELQKLVAEVATVSPATIERVRGIYSVN